MYLCFFCSHQQNKKFNPIHLPGGSFVLDVIPDHSESIFLGQTLRRPSVTQHVIDEQKYVIDEELGHELQFHPDSDSLREFLPKGTVDEINVSLNIY